LEFAVADSDPALALAHSGIRKPCAGAREIASLSEKIEGTPLAQTGKRPRPFSLRSLRLSRLATLARDPREAETFISVSGEAEAGVDTLFALITNPVAAIQLPLAISTRWTTLVLGHAREGPWLVRYFHMVTGARKG